MTALDSAKGAPKFIDAPIRLASRTIETQELDGDTSSDSAANAGFEVNMGLIWDNHHVIKLNIDDNEMATSVIVTTRSNHLVLPAKDCITCWSFYTNLWTPANETPINGENSVPTSIQFNHYTMS